MKTRQKIFLILALLFSIAFFGNSGKSSEILNQDIYLNSVALLGDNVRCSIMCYTNRPDKYCFWCPDCSYLENFDMMSTTYTCRYQPQ